MKHIAIVFVFVILSGLSGCTVITGLSDLIALNKDNETGTTPVEGSLPGTLETDIPVAVLETMTVPVPAETDSPQPLDAPQFEKAEKPGTYWITNPSSQARLFVQVVHAPGWGGGALPALVLVPGGISTGGNLLPEAKKLAEQGFTVVLFDPDGRGRSEGVEDYGGFIHQDGLEAVVRFAAGHEDTQPG